MLVGLVLKFVQDRGGGLDRTNLDMDYTEFRFAITVTIRFSPPSFLIVYNKATSFDVVVSVPPMVWTIPTGRTGTLARTLSNAHSNTHSITLTHNHSHTHMTRKRGFFFCRPSSNHICLSV